MSSLALGRLQRSKRALLLGGIVLFFCGVILVSISGYVATAGWQIPQTDINRDHLLGVAWAVALGVFIAAWPVIPEDRENLLIAWVAKCNVTLLAMLPYERRYDLDSYSYFFNMNWPVYTFHWVDRLRAQSIVIAVGWYQQHVIDSYHAVKVTFAMIGLLSIYLVYRAAMEVIGQRHSIGFLAFALFPSVLFWSSIIGKDPIVFFGVAVYVYGVVKWRATSNSRFLLVIATGIAIAVMMRMWLGLILGLPLLYFMIRGVRGFMPRLLSTIASVTIVVLMFNLFASGMSIDNTDDLVAATDRIAHQFSSDRSGASGSTRDIGFRITSVPLMIAFLPVGLVSVLYRPLPGEVRNLFGLLSGLENVLLIYLTYAAIRALIRSSSVRKSVFREPVIIWALLLVVTWTSMYGFISFQNLGASVRFRLPIIAVVFGLLLCVRWVEYQVKAPAGRRPVTGALTRASKANLAASKA